VLALFDPGPQRLKLKLKLVSLRDASSSSLNDMADGPFSDDRHLVTLAREQLLAVGTEIG